jgi:TolB protein
MLLRRALLIALGTALVAVLLVAVGARPGSAAFPGANGRIAYICSPNVPEICVINADGSGLGYLTQTDENASFDESYPAWSPDGRRIAFVVVGNCVNAIYVMNANRTELRRVLVERAARSGLWLIHDVSWSPDGNRLVYSKSFHQGRCPMHFTSPENAVIFTINVSGSGERRITNTTGIDVWDNQPAWSPDGSSIAFYHGPTINGGLYVMNPDGSARRRLDSSGTGYPNWSPDGTRIVYNCSRGLGAICVFSPGGVISPLGMGTTPAWSPDGTHIVFRLAPGQDQTNPDGGIYVMAADGTQRHEIVAKTESGETIGHPDWQPCRGTCPPAPGMPSYEKRRKPFPMLSAKVGPRFTIAIRNNAGRRVKKLVEGTYAALVNDASRRHSFHISRQGGGFNTRTTVRGIGRGPRQFWELTPGGYRYFCDAHPGLMRGRFNVVADPLGGYRP